MAYLREVQLKDKYGFEAEFTPSDEIRISEVSKLCGTAFEGTTVDANFWTASTSGAGAAVSQLDGYMALISGTAASSLVTVYSKNAARYYGGSSNMFRARAKVAAPEQEDGYFKIGVRTSTTDGAYYKFINGDLYATTLTGSTENSTLLLTGTWGADQYHKYEIYYDSNKVYFTLDGDLLHTHTVTTTLWATAKTFNILLETANVSGLGTSQVMHLSEAVICRLGKDHSAFSSKYNTGTTAAGGLIAKIGSGNLHGMVIGEVPTSGSVITIYDGVTTGGTILAKFTLSFPAGGNFNPTTIDFKGLSFSTGLLFTVLTQSATITLIYE